MITVNQYLEKLQELKNAGFGELFCIYSKDDEGNSYQHVHNIPSLWRVVDVDDYELETDFEYDENDNVIDFEPNCIIIN